MEGKALIDRIEYLMKHPEDKYNLCTMFSTEEKGILETIHELEQIQCLMEAGGIKDINEGENSDVTEKIFRKREREKDASFRLKEQIINQIDSLLEQEKAEAWLDILTWYQFLKGKGLIIDKFWEFPILETMLKAFQKEWKLYYSEGGRISVLSLHTIKELTDRYFSIVFMLRRIEYGVEPVNELLFCLLEGKVSLLVVETVLEDGRIFDKEKVKKVIDGWVGNQNG